MKKIIILTLLTVFSVTIGFAHNPDIEKLMELKIKGFKMIYHDSLLKFKFRYAHYMKTQIKKSQLELTQLKSKSQ